jgi:hypothetical protein
MRFEIKMAQNEEKRKKEKEKVMRFEIRRGQKDFCFLKNMFCK